MVIVLDEKEEKARQRAYALTLDLDGYVLTSTNTTFV